MFARAVEGEADLDGDGVLRRDELWRFVRENVRMMSEARQTPNLLPNSRGGEPVLRLTPASGVGVEESATSEGGGASTPAPDASAAGKVPRANAAAGTAVTGDVAGMRRLTLRSENRRTASAACGSRVMHADADILATLRETVPAFGSFPSKRPPISSGMHGPARS